MNLIVYLLCLPALLVVAITALVRANDIGWETALGLVWHVRRLGLVLAGAAAVALILSPVWITHTIFAFHLCASALLWGYALAWLTTPGMPPWWKYITKGLESAQPVAPPAPVVTPPPATPIVGYQPVSGIADGAASPPGSE